MVFSSQEGIGILLLVTFLYLKVLNLWFMIIVCSKRKVKDNFKAQFVCG